MLRILGPRVLVAVRPEPEETFSPMGLTLMRDPDRAKVPTQGIVVQLGDKRGMVSVEDAIGALTEPDPAAAIARLAPPPFEVQVGDCVVFSRFVGEQVTHPDEPDVTFVILHEADLLALVDPQSEAA